MKETPRTLRTALSCETPGRAESTAGILYAGKMAGLQTVFEKQARGGRTSSPTRDEVQNGREEVKGVDIGIDIRPQREYLQERAGLNSSSPDEGES